jgi:Zn-dependent protease with chaperone function
MDFFAAQDHARKTTKKMVLLFALAVIILIGLTNILIIFALGVSTGGQTSLNQELYGPDFTWKLFLIVTLLVTLVVAGGSLFKTWSINKGGKFIAEGLGGTPVIRANPKPEYRQLFNVVEEMSIASGMPIPLVYVMEDEPGINAFAAGLTTSDAVVAVSRGCAEQLDRDELQGVIAHEFSHILNGDMRLNMRLIGVLHGILIIGIIGRILLRSGSHRSSFRSSSRSD